jgi:cation/acetate symporter
VILVGTTVIIIVATAGMTSTTYVQFLKGGLLIVFSLILTVSVLTRGLSTSPDHGGDVPYHQFVTIPYQERDDGTLVLENSDYSVPADWKTSPYHGRADGTVHFVQLTRGDETSVWRINAEKGVLEETQTVTTLPGGDQTVQRCAGKSKASSTRSAT